MINRLKRAFAALHPFRLTADRPAEDMAARPAPPVILPPPETQDARTGRIQRDCTHGRWKTARKRDGRRMIVVCRNCGLHRQVQA